MTPNILKLYHGSTYPNDNPRDWWISFAPMYDRDEYVLIIKYRMRPGQGDLYSQVRYDGMTLSYYGACRPEQWSERVCQDWERMRLEIIEMLDEQLANQPKPIKKQPQYVHYFQEYPKQNDLFQWKQYYTFNGITDIQKGSAA